MGAIARGIFPVAAGGEDGDGRGVSVFTGWSVWTDGETGRSFGSGMAAAGLSESGGVVGWGIEAEACNSRFCCSDGLAAVGPGAGIE